MAESTTSVSNDLRPSFDTPIHEEPGRMLQHLVNGLASGSIYALIALGYSLVYGVLGLINFAHGHMYMVATFSVVGLLVGGAPAPVAVLAGVLLAVSLGILVERTTYRPLRNANRIGPTVSAVGAALVLENIALLTWGGRNRPFPASLDEKTWRLADSVTISTIHLVIFSTALILAGVIWALVKNSKWGKTVRAVRDDFETAELLGINVGRMTASVYAGGSALGLVGGLLFGMYYNSVFVGMAFTGTMNAFTAAVIGGIGSIWGAFIGGLVLGVIQSMSVAFVSSGYINAVTFIVLIIILVFRPYGLFGSAEVRKL